MREMRNAYKRLTGKPEGKRLRGDLGLGGKVILEWNLGNRSGGCVSIYLAQDGDHWWTLVNTVPNILVP
jgi:hypothetical protein